MQAMRFVEKFMACRSGAVTVDWVALSAAIVIAGMGVGYTVFGGAGELGLSIQSGFDDQSANISGAIPSTLPGG